jgi:hypothetical protein
LNIIIVKVKAAKMESTGTILVLRKRFSLRPATYQKGVAAAYITAHVAGLMYPSGICIYYSPFSLLLSSLLQALKAEELPLTTLPRLPAIISTCYELH